MQYLVQIDENPEVKVLFVNKCLGVRNYVNYDIV